MIGCLWFDACLVVWHLVVCVACCCVDVTRRLVTLIMLVVCMDVSWSFVCCLDCWLAWLV